MHKETRDIPCKTCPFLAGIKGDRILCLNPQVTGMERIPVPIPLDNKPPCPYQEELQPHTQKGAHSRKQNDGSYPPARSLSHLS